MRVYKRTFALVAFALLSADSIADNWQYDPQMELEVGYDDNIRLIPGDSDEGYEARAALSLGLERITKVLAIEGRIGIDLIDYFDTKADGVEAEDVQFASLDLAYNVSPLSTIGGDLLYRRDETGTNQAVDDETIDPDLALDKRQARRERLSVSPFWAYEINEKLSSELEYSYVEVDYEELDGGTLVDFSTQQVTASIRTELSNRNALTFSLGSSRYEREDSASGEDIDNDSATIDFTHTPTPSVEMGITLGYRNTSYEEEGRDQDDEGTLVRIYGSKETKAGVFRGTLERRLWPSGVGNLIETDRLSVDFKRALTPLMEFSFRARYFENDDVLNQSDSINRELLTVEPELVRKLNRDWSVGVSYSYTIEQRDDVDDAESNAVFINIRYQPQSKVKGL